MRSINRRRNELVEMDGADLLAQYESLDSDDALEIEFHQRALIEKYAEEIGY